MPDVGEMDDVVRKVGAILRNPHRPLKERFRALFTLRTLNGPAAVREITAAFADKSVLLLHELAYCLGQMGERCAVDFLLTVLADSTQHPMVRHEAGEALGAIGDYSEPVLATLRQFASDPVAEVAETCQLALGRLAWVSNPSGSSDALPDNPYLSVDPTPPAAVSAVCELEACLVDANRCLYDRYRAMFTLRNLGTAESVEALCRGFRCAGALFKHELAYVLGQMQSPLAVEALRERLADRAENCMVRHECAEALGSIATEQCDQILQTYLQDDTTVVRESCVVALDMCDYERAEFESALAILDKS